MNLSLSRVFEFAASHRLYRKEWSDQKNKEVFGKCSNSNGHGHNYRLIVSVRGALDAERGMVADAGWLKEFVTNHVLADIDHKNLNLDVPWISASTPPTVEHVLTSICERLQQALITEAAGMVELDEVTLWETSNIKAMARF